MTALQSLGGQHDSVVMPAVFIRGWHSRYHRRSRPDKFYFSLEFCGKSNTPKMFEPPQWCSGEFAGITETLVRVPTCTEAVFTYFWLGV